MAKTSNIRKSLDVGKDRTVAFAEVDVTGYNGEVVGFSGEANKGGLVPRYEKANPGSIVSGNTTRTGPGRQDAEVKILDYLRGKLNPSAKGKIRLFVDQPAQKGICEHCTQAIFEFKRDFPGIDFVPSAN